MINRREFVKLSGLGLVDLVINPSNSISQLKRISFEEAVNDESKRQDYFNQLYLESDDENKEYVSGIEYDKDYSKIEEYLLDMHAKSGFSKEFTRLMVNILLDEIKKKVPIETPYLLNIIGTKFKPKVFVHPTFLNNIVNFEGELKSVIYDNQFKIAKDIYNGLRVRRFILDYTNLVGLSFNLISSIIEVQAYFGQLKALKLGKRNVRINFYRDVGMRYEKAFRNLLNAKPKSDLEKELLLSTVSDYRKSMLPPSLLPEY